jgi:hypothetical protein
MGRGFYQSSAGDASFSSFSSWQDDSLSSFSHEDVSDSAPLVGEVVDFGSAVEPAPGELSPLGPGFPLSICTGPDSFLEGTTVGDAGSGAVVV